MVGSALLDCRSSIHRLHWSVSGVESVAVGFRVWTNKLLPDTIVSQTDCPFCSALKLRVEWVKVVEQLARKRGSGLGTKHLRLDLRALHIVERKGGSLP